MCDDDDERATIDATGAGGRAGVNVSAVGGTRSRNIAFVRDSLFKFLQIKGCFAVSGSVGFVLLLFCYSPRAVPINDLVIRQNTDALKFDDSDNIGHHSNFHLQYRTRYGPNWAWKIKSR